MDAEIFKKIIKRKQFSKLKKIDVELAWEHFKNKQTTEEEKIKLTRNLLGRSFTMFTSKRFLKIKDFNEDWILKRHDSTRERFKHYEKIYSKILKDFKKKIIIFDLGCGINGFSYKFFPKNKNVFYFGVESIGQLIDLQNFYFKKNNLKGNFYHNSLFELEKIKKIIKSKKGKKIIFLFKVLDSLENLKKGYSKKLLFELSFLVDKIVISFATQSLRSKKNFKIKRLSFERFLKENFNVLENFSLGNEQYFIFEKKQGL